MFSSNDFEKLWFLYQTEGVPEEESINSFCEKKRSFLSLDVKIDNLRHCKS